MLKSLLLNFTFILKSTMEED